MSGWCSSEDIPELLSVPGVASENAAGRVSSLHCFVLDVAKVEPAKQ